MIWNLNYSQWQRRLEWSEMTKDNANNDHKHNVVYAIYALNELFIWNISPFFPTYLFIDWIEKMNFTCGMKKKIAFAYDIGMSKEKILSKV